VSLIVDTRVPYGNACDVAVTRGQDRWTVAFAADPHGGPERLWFCFQLRQDDAANGPIGRVKLLLRHFQTMLGGNAAENVYPVMRLIGGDWQRLPAGTPEPQLDGQCYASWTIDVPARSADVAVCYTYGMPEVDSLVGESNGYWRADAIGVSQNGRPLVRLSNDYGQPGGTRPGLYLIARQHSGETPGSWVLDGFLREIATQGDAAPLVWAVPLTNIDGVEQGDYGKDNFPYDLNRAWGSPPMRHEAMALQGDIGRWRQRCRPILAIDFHAPGLSEAEGSYIFLPDPRQYQGISEAARTWAEQIAKVLTPEYAASSFARVANYASRWETPTFTAYICKLGICGFSVETPYGAIRGNVLTREHYRQTGRGMARCVMEQLNL
jgi:hypothetical protein